ncbi:hypothetical protein ONA91_18160 [Micromonospora sp. DR5-3]|uniref:hypothetical protein n=1 Tax=unclassified Micromonospora TaxID=2617518 RepID=UPI0011D5347B|nr:MULTISPECIES: hypothetical protein [unclassified Micromonospora]MCW3816372.1 hypothetical protein [Micromonospora sp. DR5-3]TYC22754.1 hypothetical protein FXF52_19070 [Micromonospora sp. MP36]
MIIGQTPGSPYWAQVLISTLGLFGGASGLGVLATVAVQRRKLKADTAGALTDAALALVQPLRTRVAELENEALAVREELAASQRELQELRATVWDLSRTLDRWREAILAPGATMRRIQALVAEEERRPRSQRRRVPPDRP